MKQGEVTVKIALDVVDDHQAMTREKVMQVLEQVDFSVRTITPLSFTLKDVDSGLVEQELHWPLDVKEHA